MEPEPTSLLFFLQSYSSATVTLEIFALIVLLFLSALMSGSEVAFFSLKKKDIDVAKDDKQPRIELIQKLLRNKKKLLATILVGNNFINIGIVLLSAYLSANIIHPYLEGLSFLGINFTVIFDVIIITFILLLFGEIIPKIYSAQNALKFSQFTAPSIQFAQLLTKPIALPLLWMSNLLEKNLKTSHKISVDQLSQALELTSEDAMTTSEEQKILEGIVSFGNTETRQIMTPRVDMYALRLNMTFDQVINGVSDKGYSRVPVYDDNIDEIRGILYAKDLLPYLNKEEVDWVKLLRKPFFVSENKKLDDLLSDFQDRKTHLAVVVDEYGGTSGIVSLEDVLEEVVGDISDEFDDEQIYYSKLDHDNFLFEGKTSLKDFFRLMEVEEEDLFDEHKGEAETLAGFVLEIAQEVPNRRQKITFENYVFAIESLDKKRIKRIKVTRTPRVEENQDDE
ncbi:gliding motility-associated protein GldE [Weeksellaceae bacterium KMM 9724]|uniref:gliding motility-associated protein GldE n=1 Tax=Profundicola chukchiensis TaxID=2961959 RepID=UPI00243D5EA7|nr:gliding motility-associated protein GldE [Profundicola chukchiensis]MDG4949390.1 gliding motility-associated protein GldE [Profundicola chukchiensis]